MNEWQTIVEFKKNPVLGWCWISNKIVDMAYYDGEVFAYNDYICCDDEIFTEDMITHVMPIQEPSYPTEPQMLIL